VKPSGRRTRVAATTSRLGWTRTGCGGSTSRSRAGRTTTSTTRSRRKSSQAMRFVFLLSLSPNLSLTISFFSPRATKHLHALPSMKLRLAAVPPPLRQPPTSNLSPSAFPLVRRLLPIRLSTTPDTLSVPLSFGSSSIAVLRRPPRVNSTPAAAQRLPLPDSPAVCLRPLPAQWLRASFGRERRLQGVKVDLREERCVFPTFRLRRSAGDSSKTSFLSVQKTVKRVEVMILDDSSDEEQDVKVRFHCFPPLPSVPLHSLTSLLFLCADLSSSPTALSLRPRFSLRLDNFHLRPSSIVRTPLPAGSLRRCCNSSSIRLHLCSSQRRRSRLASSSCQSHVDLSHLPRPYRQPRPLHPPLPPPQPRRSPPRVYRVEGHRRAGEAIDEGAGSAGGEGKERGRRNGRVGFGDDFWECVEGEGGEMSVV
jgi:hypothetical protein